MFVDINLGLWSCYMIIVRTLLDIADNSGVKKVMCIKVLGGTRKKYASIGEVIKVSVKEVIPNVKVKKGDVCYALVVRSKYGLKRRDGSSVKFSTNSAVLLNEQKQFVGTRVFGSVLREIKVYFPKVASLAQEVL